MQEQQMNFRGPKDSPVLVIGDSLPFNPTTKNRVKEVLDRRHVIYKSIIIPIKYYMNDYLMLYNKRLPSERNNLDIFCYMNAAQWVKRENRTEWSFQKDDLKKILGQNFKIILCMGEGAFSSVMELARAEEAKCPREIFKTKKSEGSLFNLGRYFAKYLAEYNPEIHDFVILPILHNSANRSFHKTDRFCPSGSEFISHDQYIAHELASLMIKDKAFENFLIPTPA